MGDKVHHVRFSGGSTVGRDNNILIQPQRHGQIDAHLGFLQLNHRYHVEFSIPWNPCIHRGGKNNPPAIPIGPCNPNYHVVDLKQEKDGLKLKIELLAYKDKILREVVQIACCKEGAPLKIQLNSRVLGKDKGTPLLRNGIHNLGVKAEKSEPTAAKQTSTK